jgi:hypothetical protein
MQPVSIVEEEVSSLSLSTFISVVEETSPGDAEHNQWTAIQDFL